ncbi:MAG TPA: HAMP domain-containing sensor histidine kinase [Bryobacteraceae bacterium]|nr:HAMP domain-containing sensor histidine kinase [Bryobacteraceae bacterium]
MNVGPNVDGGSRRSVSISGLAPGTTYYFRPQVRDPDTGLVDTSFICAISYTNNNGHSCTTGEPPRFTTVAEIPESQKVMPPNDISWMPTSTPTINGVTMTATDQDHFQTLLMQCGNGTGPFTNTAQNHAIRVPIGAKYSHASTITGRQPRARKTTTVTTRGKYSRLRDSIRRKVTLSKSGLHGPPLPFRKFVEKDPAALQEAERKRILNDPTERIGELARTNRINSEFLARMSHHTRTPLNSIIGFSDLMIEQSDGPLDATYIHYVRHVREGAHHLLELVNEILDLARLDAGKIELRYQEFAAIDPISEVLAVIRPLAEAKRIDLRNEVPPESCVYADRTRFKQILYNLVSNAVRFTPPEGTVRLGVEPRDAEACFIVSDTGLGTVNGSGLGLAITKHLVELHGCYIRVESAPGGGSRFCFTMPAAPADELGEE